MATDRAKSARSSLSVLTLSVTRLHFSVNRVDDGRVDWFSNDRSSIPVELFAGSEAQRLYVFTNSFWSVSIDTDRIVNGHSSSLHGFKQSLG